VYFKEIKCVDFCTFQTGMNLQVNPDVKYSGIKKQAFQLKNSRRDG